MEALEEAVQVVAGELLNVFRNYLVESSTDFEMYVGYTTSMKLAPILTAAALTFSFGLPAFAQTTALENETVSTESGKGELQVSVESAPLLGSMPKGASRVEMAVLNISASCEADVTVTEVTVSHFGLGNVSDITAVYLNDGFRRISRTQTFDSRSRDAVLRVTSLVIPKCSAVRVKILFDISRDATVASEHGASIVHASAIASTAKATTLLRTDVTQRTFTTAKDAGAITVNLLPIKGPLRYARREIVARLQVTADTKNDHLLRSVTFKNLGDARDMNLINFTLETRRGEVLSPVAQRMRGLTVKLDFDPTYVLERGRTAVFLLKAQINASQSKKIQFTVEEPSDIDSTLYRPSR